MLLLLGVWTLWEVLDFVVKAAMPVPSEWETVSEPRWRRSRICVGGRVSCRFDVILGGRAYETAGQDRTEHNAERDIDSGDNLTRSTKYQNESPRNKSTINILEIKNPIDLSKTKTKNQILQSRAQ